MTLFQRWKQTALHNKALVWTSILVAFGTLFYAGAAVFQIIMMRQVAREASNQTDRLIGKADSIARSLDAALKQNQSALSATLKQSRDALDVSILIAQNEERAWIVVPSKYGLTDLVVAGGPITYLMGFVNAGKTPASRVNALVRAQVVPRGQEPSFTYPPGTSTQYEVGELVPNDEQAPVQLQARDANAAVSLAAEQVERIMAGLDYVATYGEVTYSDIAGRHWMRFCRAAYTGPREKGRTPQKCGQYNSSGDGKALPNFQ